MSQPSNQLSPSPQVRNEPRRSGARYPRPLLLIVLFGFVVPYVLLIQIPHEIGRWHLLSAYEFRAKGDATSAYGELAAAEYWFPNSPELLLQRAEWKLDDDEPEGGLADCDAMLTAAGNKYPWLAIHASFLQQAGKFADAVNDWKKIEQFSQRSGIPGRATALNGLAYARAVAKIEQDEALADVNEALELVPGEPNVLDTRGYIHFLRNDYDAALIDLDKAVGGVDKVVEAAEDIPRSSLTSSFFRRAVSMRPKVLAEFRRPPDAATEKSLAAKAAAVVHYHRSLVLEALDRNEEAEKDRESVRKLIGKDPDETLF